MKLHLPVTSAIPAGLAVASIALSLLILPGGGSPARTASVAPALRIAAGDVVAVVSSPIRAVTSSQKQPTTTASPTTAVAATGVAGTGAVASTATTRSSSSSITSSRPSPRTVRHSRVSQKHPAAPTPKHVAPVSVKPATAAAAAKPATAPAAERGHGKAKAVGHVRKAATAQAALQAAPTQPTEAHGAAKAHGRPADVPKGPPAVPPGQEKHDQDAAQPGPGKGGGNK